MTPIRPNVILSHAGLRGVAVFCVFAGHLFELERINLGLTQLPFKFLLWGGFGVGGAVIVDLFFILSGFILYHVYVNNDCRIASWRGYFIARVARIFPLYYLTLLVYPFKGTIFLQYLSKAFFSGENLPNEIKRLAFLNLAMISGIISGFSETVNPPSWSISVEMLLYIVAFPVLVLTSSRLSSRAGSVLVLVLIVMLFECYDKTIPSKFMGWPWRFTGRGFVGFGIGFLLCSMVRHQQIPGIIKSNKVRKCFLYICLPLVYASFVAGLADVRVFDLAFPMLVLCTASDTGVFCRVLMAGPLQWLGDRSYSIYLWHYPILVVWGMLPKEIIRANGGIHAMINMLAIGTVVLLVAALSYRYFEIPSRNLVRNLGIRQRVRSA